MVQRSNELREKLYGKQKEDITEDSIKKEIVLNEPAKKLSELPFFNKAREMTSYDKLDIGNEGKKIESPGEPGIINNIEKPQNDFEKPENSEEPLNISEGEPGLGDFFIEGKANPYTDKFLPPDEPGKEINNELIEKENQDNYENPEQEEKLNWSFEKTPEPVELIHKKEHHTEGPDIDRFPLLIETIRKFYSDIKPEELFITIPLALCELLNAETGVLYLIDKETNEFRTMEKNGADFSESRLKLPGNLFTESINEKKIISMTYPHDNETGEESQKGEINNILIFPLINKENEPIGIIELTNSRRGSFNAKDESILTELSPLILLALENSEYIQNLLHSDRLVSLNKMANFLIHDIKNPIVSIKQYSEHIKKQDISPEINQVLDMIVEQADSVVDLVHTTLGYSEGRIISKPQTLLLSIAMESILSLLAEYVESRNVKLYKKLDGDGLVNLDKKEFYQACFQIAKNACDAMPQGGNFYIITKREGDKIRIEFKVTGLGIPESIKDRIFEPFMSHGKKEKTGLGLAIAEKIVKEHEGKIWAESDLGEGAVFIIELPAVD